MKNQFVRNLIIVGAFGLGLKAIAEGRPDPAEFQAAIKNCESSSYNTDQISLPAPAPGERPSLTSEQQALIDACRSAGILPSPPHGGHHNGPRPNGPPPDGALPPDSQRGGGSVQ